MNKRSLLHLLLIILAAVTLLLAGCEGDEGDRGPQGPPGPAAEPGAGGGDDGAALQAQPDLVVIPAEITAASVPAEGGQPTVTFTVSDQDGAPITDLTAENLQASELRFIIAKLQEPAAGEPANWQSYINRTEQGVAPFGPGETPALESAIQATTETNGTLTNNGGGSYTYTFNTDLRNVTAPLAVSFEPNRTHRVAIQIEFEETIDNEEVVLVANPTFDFVPAGGTPEEPEVVTTQQCNECHDLLVAHGARIEVKYCVTCHNPGSVDANSGNTVDFPVMTHKIHRGRDLPSVLGVDDELGTADDGEYAIWGFRNTKHDYSNLGYPQDIRFCTKCHEEGVAPQGNNWREAPAIATCGSCHDDIIFNLEVQGLSEPLPFMRNHSGGVPVTNEDCADCHQPEGGLAPVTAAHTIPELAAARNFQYNLLGTDFADDTRTLSITFSVTNPNDGTAYDLFQNPAFTQTASGTSRLFIDVGGPPEEFDNIDSGVDPAQPIQINVLDLANVTANGDGSYTTTVILPEVAEAVGVALEGHPAAENPDAGEEGAAAFLRVPVTNAFTSVSLGGDAGPTRRQIVSIDKCNVCHNVLSLHGNNRTNNLNVCVMCHNPNATDVEVRPVDGGEEAIDFKTMIHGLHANEMRVDADPEDDIPAGLVIFGFGGSAHEFGLDSTTGEAVRFPGDLENCLNCHVDESYQIPLRDIVLATTIDTGDDLTTPLDDTNISPTAAVCFYCHNSNAARDHMIDEGGAEFNLVGGTFDPRAGDTIEICVACHGRNTQASLEAEHAIREETPIPAPEPVLGEAPAPPGNQPPTANAGTDVTDAPVGTPVQLNAGASTDPENQQLTFAWTLQAPEGSTTATLSDPNIANPTFTPDVAGTYTATVTVNDGTQTATDSVTITTAGAAPEPPAPPAGDPVAGQTVYNGQCAGCHALSPFDTSTSLGAPDLAGDPAAVDERFTPGNAGSGTFHTGITLSAEQITNLKAFIANPAP